MNRQQEMVSNNPLGRIASAFDSARDQQDSEVIIALNNELSGYFERKYSAINAAKIASMADRDWGELRAFCREDRFGDIRFELLGNENIQAIIDRFFEERIRKEMLRIRYFNRYTEYTNSVKLWLHPSSQKENLKTDFIKPEKGQEYGYTQNPWFEYRTVLFEGDTSITGPKKRNVQTEMMSIAYQELWGYCPNVEYYIRGTDNLSLFENEFLESTKIQSCNNILQSMIQNGEHALAAEYVMKADPHRGFNSAFRQQVPVKIYQQLVAYIPSQLLWKIPHEVVQKDIQIKSFNKKESLLWKMYIREFRTVFGHPFSYTYSTDTGHPEHFDHIRLRVELFLEHFPQESQTLFLQHKCLIAVDFFNRKQLGEPGEHSLMSHMLRNSSFEKIDVLQVVRILESRSEHGEELLTITELIELIAVHPEVFLVIRTSLYTNLDFVKSVFEATKQAHTFGTLNNLMHSGSDMLRKLYRYDTRPTEMNSAVKAMEVYLNTDYST